MKCKKVTYDSGSEQKSVLFGVIIQEDPFFITFKTSNREYRIAKSIILLIEETEREFMATVED